MSIILVQLGDIHLRHSDDLALVRAPQIGAAIAAELNADVPTIILALSGDATYSGMRDQFDLATTLIKSIEDAIREPKT